MLVTSFCLPFIFPGLVPPTFRWVQIVTLCVASTFRTEATLFALYLLSTRFPELASRRSIGVLSLSRYHSLHLENMIDKGFVRRFTGHRVSGIPAPSSDLVAHAHVRHYGSLQRAWMLALQGYGQTTGWTLIHIAQEREGFPILSEEQTREKTMKEYVHRGAYLELNRGVLGRWKASRRRQPAGQDPYRVRQVWPSLDVHYTNHWTLL